MPIVIFLYATTVTVIFTLARRPHNRMQLNNSSLHNGLLDEWNKNYKEWIDRNCIRSGGSINNIK